MATIHFRNVEGSQVNVGGTGAFCANMTYNPKDRPRRESNQASEGQRDQQGLSSQAALRRPQSSPQCPSQRRRPAAAPVHAHDDVAPSDIAPSVVAPSVVTSSDALNHTISSSLSAIKRPPGLLPPSGSGSLGTSSDKDAPSTEMGTDAQGVQPMDEVSCMSVAIAICD